PRRRHPDGRDLVEPQSGGGDGLADRLAHPLQAELLAAVRLGGQADGRQRPGVAVHDAALHCGAPDLQADEIQRLTHDGGPRPLRRTHLQPVRPVRKTGLRTRTSIITERRRRPQGGGYSRSKAMTTQVTLSREPRSRATRTRCSAHAWGAAKARAPSRRSFSSTWLVRPSLASSRRSPAWGVNGRTSAPSAMSAQPRNLCRTCCQGLWRASSALSTPVSTRALAIEWSTVSSSTRSPRIRYARLSPRPATYTRPARSTASTAVV